MDLRMRLKEPSKYHPNYPKEASSVLIRLVIAVLVIAVLVIVIRIIEIFADGFVVSICVHLHDLAAGICLRGIIVVISVVESEVLANHLIEILAIPKVNMGFASSIEADRSSELVQDVTRRSASVVIDALGTGQSQVSAIISRVIIDNAGILFKATHSHQSRSSSLIVLCQVQCTLSALDLPILLAQLTASENRILLLSVGNPGGNEKCSNKFIDHFVGFDSRLVLFFVYKFCKKFFLI